MVEFVAETQPSAPDGVFLKSVSADSAVIAWADPSVTGADPVDSYHVQLRRGASQSSPWATAVNECSLLCQ